MVTVKSLYTKRNDGRKMDEEGWDEDGDGEELHSISININKSHMLYVHQEKWQRDLMRKYGSNICLMDATYKTTKYDIPLFFICVLTNNGYEIVGK